jgi:HK97 gp10 family phage protein
MYQVDIPKKEVIVGNTVSYAPFVTMGTRYMEARPFMQNAINNYQKDYEEVAKKYLGEGFE